MGAIAIFEKLIRSGEHTEPEIHPYHEAAGGYITAAWEEGSSPYPVTESEAQRLIAAGAIDQRQG